MLEQDPPVMVEAVLLPWKDRIVCDGLIRPHRVMFGSGYRRSMKESYQQAEAQGIITRWTRTGGQPFGNRLSPRRPSLKWPDLRV